MSRNDSESLPTPPDRSEVAARRVELLISTLLRVGVITSLTVVAAGTLISFIHHPSYVWSPAKVQRLTRPGAAFPRTLRQVYDGVLDLRGQAIVMVGLFLLIATPVMRVAVSVVMFAVRRERVFTAVTAVVLALLLLSFALGRAGG
jgi:uncharacterized membrane protein